MIGFLNLQSTAGLDKPAAGAGKGQSADGAQAGGFAALLAGAIAGEDSTATPASGDMAKLATLLGKFRGEAQTALSDAFPDGEIAPGETLNDWAQSMLTKLDGMLSEAGFDWADLGQMLAPMKGLMQGGVLPQGLVLGGALTQAARGLMSGMAQSGQAGQSSATGQGGTQSGPAVPGLDGADPLGTGLGLDGSLTDEVAIPTLRDALALTSGDGAATGTTGSQKSTLAALVSDPDVRAGLTELTQADPNAAAPLPDALKILFAQALTAPGDRTLPPEVQAILAAPQPTAAPLIASVAETSAPPPSQSNPQNGLARNLAGQIRGVSFSEGTTRIELSPQGLGKIEVEIAADEAGKLRVVLRAENPAVLNAMRSDRDMLAGLLRDGGTTVDDSAMSFEEFGQQGQTNRQDSDAGQVASRLTLDDDADATDIPAPEAQQTITEDGRLNILT